jgi:hypothetical protein
VGVNDTYLSYMKLRELRTLIRTHLLLNEGDVIDLANRMTSNRSVVVIRDSVMVVISLNEVQKNRIGTYTTQVPNIPKVLGYANLDSQYGYWVVESLYADDPSTLVVLLSALLEHFEKLCPDAMLSPASSAVLKRYYDANKDDPTKIKQDACNRDSRHDYQRALYLGPVGFNIDAAFSKSMAVIKKLVNNNSRKVEMVLEDIYATAVHGFKTAYNDPERTKQGSFKDWLKRKEIPWLFVSLDNMFQTGDEKLSTKAAQFIRDNKEEIDRFVKGNLPTLSSKWDELQLSADEQLGA